jgi:sigma-E factor negative regulatory protein RseB
MSPFLILASCSALFVVVSLPVYAGSEAHDWLMRIGQAARKLNYEGTFVHQHGAQLETMWIAHRVSNGSVSERLVSLTGPAREIIRTDREVRCYLPDQNSVVEQRRLDESGFLAIAPERIADLEQNYVIELGTPARVAGRPAQRLLIQPRDDFRYGYQLWADMETGLLLKADVMNEKRKVLEQFMFTQISIGKEIPVSALAPQTPETGMVWYRDNDAPVTQLKQSWRATRLPKGFKLSSAVVRRMPRGDRAVEQLVYSDGLATISVFVEKMVAGTSSTMMEGPTRMGALYALGKSIDSHHVTVVGEVPAKTIAMIGSSFVPASLP